MTLELNLIYEQLEDSWTVNETYGLQFQNIFQVLKIVHTFSQITQIWKKIGYQKTQIWKKIGFFNII